MAVSYNDLAKNPQNYFLVIFDVQALRRDGHQELTAIAGFDLYWNIEPISEDVIDITSSFWKGRPTGYIRYVRKGVYFPLILKQEKGLWVHTAEYSAVYDRVKLAQSNESISVEEVSNYLTEQIRWPHSFTSNEPEFVKHADYKGVLCTLSDSNKRILPTQQEIDNQRELDLLSLKSAALVGTKAAQHALEQLQKYHHFLENASEYICASFSVPKDTSAPIVPPGFKFTPGNQISGGLIKFSFEVMGKRDIQVPYLLGLTKRTSVYEVSVKPDGVLYRTILLADVKKIVAELTGLDGLEVKDPNVELLGYPELLIEKKDVFQAEVLTISNQAVVEKFDEKNQLQDLLSSRANREAEIKLKDIENKRTFQLKILENDQALKRKLEETQAMAVEILEFTATPHHHNEGFTTVQTSVEVKAAEVLSEVAEQAATMLPTEIDNVQAQEPPASKGQTVCLYPHNASVRFTATDVQNLSLMDYEGLIFDKLKAECPALADALANDALSEVLYWDRFCFGLGQLLQLSRIFMQLQKEPCFKDYTYSFFMSAYVKSKSDKAEFNYTSRGEALFTLLKQQRYPTDRLALEKSNGNRRHDRILQLIFVSGARFELNFSYGMAFYDVLLPDLDNQIGLINNEKDHSKRKATLGALLVDLQAEYRPLCVQATSASMTIGVSGFSAYSPDDKQD
jgi:hypothetical protein